MGASVNLTLFIFLPSRFGWFSFAYDSLRLAFIETFWPLFVARIPLFTLHSYPRPPFFLPLFLPRGFMRGNSHKLSP